jgi:predicted Zn-dependent protease
MCSLETPRRKRRRQIFKGGGGVGMAPFLLRGCGMKRWALAALLCLVAGCISGPMTTPAKPGQEATSFNLFTVDQDIEIGKQSAAEAEKQLTLLGDPAVDAYLNRIVSALTKEAPGAKYPYHAKAVREKQVNAFALPGGPMYVNSGLLQAARSEAELAGVMGHELAHVALRHGTHQASEAYAAKTGLGVLGGLLGGGTGADVLTAIGGVGLNAAFLKFSRDAETEADVTGAGMMARAGYDPNAMADFFALLREESGRDPSSLEAFLSDHPSPADREVRIRELAKTLPRGPAHSVGGFEEVKTAVR